MNLSHKSSQQRAADPIYRKLHRPLLAMCIIIAPVVLFLGFAFDPTGGVGVPSSVSVLDADFRADLAERAKQHEQMVRYYLAELK